MKIIRAMHRTQTVDQALPQMDNHRGLSLQDGGIMRIVGDGPRATPNDRLCRGRPKPALSKAEGAVPKKPGHPAALTEALRHPKL